MGGSVAGPLFFSGAYEPKVEQWLDETSDPRLVAACPFSERTVDSSLTAFVDDLFHILILDNCRASHVALTVACNDYESDKGMSETGVAQHPGKLEYCGSFVGAGSLSIQRDLARGNVLHGQAF